MNAAETERLRTRPERRRANKKGSPKGLPSLYKTNPNRVKSFLLFENIAAFRHIRAG